MIRLAIIDVGHRLNDYLFALPRLNDAIVTVIVDSDETVANALCAASGARTVVNSWEQLSADDAKLFDAVVIHSPHPRRLDLVGLAAAAGKHMLVDTPLATTSSAAEQAVAACEAANVELMSYQPLRHMPYQVTVRDNLAAGKLGRPGLLRIHHWHPHNSEIVYDTDPRDRTDLIIREVDIACWLFDAFPDFVSAQAFANHAPHTGVHIHFGFPAGGMALIDCTESLPAGADPYYSLTLIGSTGAAYADDHHNTNLLLERDAVGLRAGQDRACLAASLREFVEAAERNGVTHGNGEESLRALTVTQAVTDALDSRRVARFVEGRYELQ